MTTTLTMPSVLAFDRKLEPSDALMFSGNWDDIGNDKAWQPIALFERHNRAVKSNFKQEILNDETELQKQIAEANLAWGDDAALSHENDTLKVSFTLRVVSGLSQPSVCNKVDFEKAYSEKVEAYVQENIEQLANRYAYNIANGRFLWRNRVGVKNVRIHARSEGFLYCVGSGGNLNLWDVKAKNKITLFDLKNNICCLGYC